MSGVSHSKQEALVNDGFCVFKNIIDSALISKLRAMSDWTIRQEKPVINAKYLHENDTFFDGSGVVHDADDEDKVMEFIELFQSGSGPTIEKEVIDEFMAYRVDGIGKGTVISSDNGQS